MNKPTAVGVGAEQGLGAATCRRFAREGHHVLVAGRTSAKIERIVQTIADAGGSAEAVLTDATSEGDIVGLFDRTIAPARASIPSISSFSMPATIGVSTFAS